MPKTASFLLLFAFTTVLQLFNFPKITSLLPEPDNASPVYETPLPLSRYQLQLNCKTLRIKLLLNGLIYQIT
jgi:hypothetical protein